MNPNRDFTLTLVFEAETDRKGMDILSFHDKFQEPFYLAPDQWEVGLLKTLIPHSRMIPMPRLRFEILHTLISGGAIGDSTNKYVFDVPAITTYSIDQYLTDVNIVLARTIRNKEDLDETHIKFEMKCENDRLVIPEFKWLKVERVQRSQIKFLDLDVWKNLGFLNIQRENTLYNTPYQASMPCQMGSKTTTLAISSPNLIESQLFGDTYKAVLELVPYHFSPENLIVEYSFTTASYKRLIGGYISEIELDLEDLDEKIISIPVSYYQFVLHFRPCQSTTKMP